MAETVSGLNFKYPFDLLVTNTTQNLHMCVCQARVHMYLQQYMHDH